MKESTLQRSKEEAKSLAIKSVISLVTFKIIYTIIIVFSIYHLREYVIDVSERLFPYGVILFDIMLLYIAGYYIIKIGCKLYVPIIVTMYRLKHSKEDKIKNKGKENE